MKLEASRLLRNIIAIAIAIILELFCDNNSILSLKLIMIAKKLQQYEVTLQHIVDKPVLDYSFLARSNM